MHPKIENAFVANPLLAAQRRLLLATVQLLNAQLRQWLAEAANVRTHGTIKQRPVERLPADQEAMLPLVARPFPAAERAQRLTDHDARSSFGGVRYSVDPAILGPRRGESVEVCVGTDERLRIYHHGHLVGEHPVLPSGSPPRDDPRHAATRRRLRQQPGWKRPAGNTPHFQLEAARLEERSPLDVVDQLLDIELKARHDRRVEINLKFAGLPYRQPLEDFDFDAQPSIDSQLVARLATLRFLEDGTNVLLLGPPGVGKTVVGRELVVKLHQVADESLL